jgi:Peptidoglycan-binding protein, CsiV
MTAPLTRRAFLAGLAACASLPSLAAEAPSGSARYLVEILVFRQPGTLPPPMPVAPLAIVTTIPGRVEALPETAWQLASAGEAIGRRGGYQLLAHTAWAAIVPPNGRTTARLEDVLQPGAPLAGAVGLQRSQYLFLGVEVDYQPEPGVTYGLREKRRIKFGERHYFDHPAFGVIAQVTTSRGEAAAD